MCRANITTKADQRVLTSAVGIAVVELAVIDGEETILGGCAGPVGAVRLDDSADLGSDAVGVGASVAVSDGVAGVGNQGLGISILRPAET